MRESEGLIEEIRMCAKNAVLKSYSKKGCDWNTAKSKIKNDLGDFLYSKTKRKPMILPVINEI